MGGCKTLCDGADEVAFEQLEHADVYGEAEVLREGRGGPASQLFTGGVEDPVTDLKDKAGVFCDGDEFGR